MKRRIETKTSQTAQMICCLRAASYLEKNPLYRSGDSIAVQIIPFWVRALLRIPFLRRFFLRYTPKGIYEYVIARTKYIDEIFSNAVEYEQIRVLGAGFDSRAIRFKDALGTTRIFEMEMPITQKAKIGRYKEKDIPIPANLEFIPIDFAKEKIEQKLNEYGFKKNKKSLFLLEGVTMYLTNTAIESTFSFIRDVARKGSLAIFDYIYAGVLREENRYYGERDIFRTVSKAGEAWTFALEKGAIEDFLLRYGFTLKNHSNAQDLEARFFKNQERKIVGKVNGTHSIVTAIRG